MEKNADIDDHSEIAADIGNEYREVFNAVMKLDEKYRPVIYLYYYEGYSTDEIGQILGMPSATVRTHLARARIILKEKIGDDI